MPIIADRRALHRIPELDCRLPQTMQYLTKRLEGLNCRLFSPIESSLCAWFDFGREQTLAFRADCDALAVQEQTGLEFSSAIPGQMHACGHDGHMAILLELARRLSKEKTMKHNILLIFQPAEETLGGARLLCDTGFLENYRVKALFGLHLWPGLDEGTVFSRPGELMSRSSEVNVDIYGKSAHIAKADQGIDALEAGLEFYRRAVAMERSLPASVHRLLKFGLLQSGTVRNALSAHTRLEGSLRAFQDDIFEGMRDTLLSIGRDIEDTFGAKVELSFSEGYGAVINPEDLARQVAAAVPYRLLDTPSMTSEDFSFYQRRCPAMFFFLGVGDTPPLHAATFTFDERILLKGADFFEKLAKEFP